ncbi:MAG: phosphotransferase [Dehalococcoidia bacterium]|jgi:aminoglycoside phosphotransferase (APT) family kinase protein
MSAAPGAKIGSGRAAEVFEYGPGRIIKLLREPGPAEWLEREAAAQSAARAAGVAAPEVFGIEELDGRRGIVMERVEGLDGLTAIDRKPWRVWAVGRETGRLHRQLSEVAAPAGLRDVRSFVTERVESSVRVPAAARDRLRAVLERAPDGNRLCHFDFHPGNVMESPAGPVIIDFTNAASGHPMADHARSLMTFAAGEPAEDTPLKERILVAIGRGLAKKAYQSGYGAVDNEALALWMPLVIAARLDEGIPEERTRLLKMLSRSLRAAEAV